MTEMENRSSERFASGLSAMPSAAMKTVAMESAAMEMTRGEMMAVEVVSPIPPSVATEVRAINRTKKSVTGASAEQEDCGCGN